MMSFLSLRAFKICGKATFSLNGQIFENPNSQVQRLIPRYHTVKGLQYGKGNAMVPSNPCIAFMWYRKTGHAEERKTSSADMAMICAFQQRPNILM